MKLVQMSDKRVSQKQPDPHVHLERLTSSNIATLNIETKR